MIAAAAPTRVRARLASASGPVSFLHRSPAAVYLDVDGWCVGVVGSAASAVPCALRVATPGIGSLAHATSATVTGGVLHLDDEPLAVGRILDVVVPRLGSAHWLDRAGPSSPSRQDVPGLAEIRAELPGRALSLLAAGDPEAVPELVGRGSGLTPAGDDVLCGWLALHHAAGVDVLAIEEAVSAALSRTTTLSATMLDCAMHGEVLPEFAALVRAVDDPSVDPAPFVAALAAIGHTSGRALLLGAELALRSLGWDSLPRSGRSLCA